MLLLISFNNWFHHHKKKEEHAREEGDPHWSLPQEAYGAANNNGAPQEEKSWKDNNASSYCYRPSHLPAHSENHATLNEEGVTFENKISSLT